MYVNTLTIKFKNKIRKSEVTQFRGACIAAAGEDCSQLFHNHDGDSFQYRYPMIQYKRIGGQAAIVCIGQGVEDIGHFFANSDYSFQLGDAPAEPFEVESIVPHRTLVQVWDDAFRYRLRDWLPLNSDNYRKYMETEGVADRITMLENILIGNILSACKGLGITIESQILCKIINIDEPRVIRYKQMSYLSFDGVFKCNVSLPGFIGIGKGASTGHGVILKINNN